MMDRAQFMQELEKLLADISETERQDALDFYNSYFDDAGAENEASVLRELGSPEKVAAIIKADLKGSAGGYEYGEYTEHGYEDARIKERGQMPERYGEESGTGKRFFRKGNQAVLILAVILLVFISLIFRSMFATDGLINSILIKLGILTTGYNFLGNSTSAKIVIIIALIWRWTGYNMVFYLAGLQNIEYSVYEAAKIDGANGWKTFWKITVPLLKPTIIMTFIMSINGTLQLFDESVNLTKGGPANTTITMSHYVYNTCFINVPNFGYAAAMSFIIFIMVAILAFINLKVGDTRD